MVSPATPHDVAPPLLPCYAGTHTGSYTDHGTCSTPAAHCTPLRVTPAEPAAAGAVNVILPPPVGEMARTVEPAAAVVLPVVPASVPGSGVSVPPAAGV